MTFNLLKMLLNNAKLEVKVKKYIPDMLLLDISAFKYSKEKVGLYPSELRAFILRVAGVSMNEHPNGLKSYVLVNRLVYLTFR